MLETATDAVSPSRLHDLYLAPDVQRLGTAEGLTAGASNSGFGDAISLIT